MSIKHCGFDVWRMIKINTRAGTADSCSRGNWNDDLYAAEFIDIANL